MPENLADLHVMAVTTDGNVWHTRRSPNGWTPFVALPNLPGPAVDVACVRRLAVAPETAPATDGLWAFIAFENAPPQLRFRNSDTSQWESAVPGNILPLPTATRVAVTVSPGVAPPGDPNAGAARAYVHLAVLANGVTPPDQGRIIAAIMPNRGAGGVPSAIAEVQTSGAGDLGAAVALALAPATSIAPVPGQESVAALGVTFDDGSLFFTSGGVSASASSGHWEPFRARDLVPPGGPGARPGRIDDVALATGQAGPAIADPNEYLVAVRGGGDADVYGATLSSSGWDGWNNFEIFRAPFVSVDTEPGNFRRVSVSKAAEGLHVIGVAQPGLLLHQLRTPAAPGLAIFRDVEVVGVGQDIGTVVAAACG
jgi:hypothetical protein